MINDVQKMPPHVDATDCVILFDGVCKLCNVWARFVIRYDTNHRLKLCSVQSKEGQDILKHFGFRTDYYETMMYIENHKCYQKSSAFFGVMNKLGTVWKMICLFQLIPTSMRDWMYDRIALNRYQLFGKYDQCILPTPDHNKRFIHE